MLSHALEFNNYSLSAWLQWDCSDVDWETGRQQRFAVLSGDIICKKNKMQLVRVRLPEGQ
jgi:hypothetical protein